MRILALILVFLVSTLNAGAQIFPGQTGIVDPISWEASVEKQNDSIYHLIFKADIEPGWHLYSQRETQPGGPIQTKFTYIPSEEYKLVGKTRESEGISGFDKFFQMDVKYFENEAKFVQPVKIISSKLPVIEAEVYFNVCDDTRCLAPERIPFKISLESGKAINANANATVSEEDVSKTDALKIDLKGSTGYILEKHEKSGYMGIFFLGFLGGLIALLTPCVFPMIPLTVSFFTKGSQDKKKGLANAILYGFFIFLIYVLLSLPFHLLDSLDPGILNSISTNVTLNVIFFVIFIAFAFSFFGYYEITLPSSWSNKMDDKASSIGGFIGIFFMAVTLAFVSFSCTGPILGSLLGGSLSSDGGAMQLSFGMGGFGLALALPFALFALFPGWLNSLPKSGGWLNVVKVVLGFIELALAFKFLSNADLVSHWGILKREIFIGIWIIIGIGLMLYLFGIIRFPHDGPKSKPGKGRMALGILTLLFVLYLIPGLTNTSYANLKLLSGFPPPLNYSIYDKDVEGVLGLKQYKDFEAGVAAAKAQNKPILLDFTGYACVNCRKMEEQVWSVPEIYEIINNDYILISLYVDDKKELPEAAQFNYEKPTGGVKEIRTVGDKWATFQTVNFKNNSQPYYVLLSPNLTMLNKPVGYTPDEEEYKNWLLKGLENFGNKK
ncbi:MAG TPA: cytochrome c biogenesis protein CcdA [Salinimicrobium sp.]|nr:cytochrome c biogenesis protein CcdA [Salinimicrobium sp.]